MYLMLSNLSKRLLERYCALFFAAVLSILTVTTHASSTLDKRPSVNIPLLDWSSQRVISIAIGNLLKEQGYKVNYQSMSEEKIWGALARGLVHFQIEIWQASANEEFQAMIKKNRLADLGKHSVSTIEEWWYPEYVEDLCPELPDWRALNKCAALFSRDGSDQGTYLTGPWPYRDADLIRSLKLNFKIERFSDSEAIWLELATAEAKKRAIIILNWTPNWTDERVPGKFIKFPSYHPDCETDPSWGLNPLLKFDCGNIQDGWIKKAAWAGLEQKDPCIYSLIKRLDLDNLMIAEASALVDYDGHNEKNAAHLWLKKYRASMQDLLTSPVCQGRWVHQTE